MSVTTKTIYALKLLIGIAWLASPQPLGAKPVCLSSHVSPRFEYGSYEQRIHENLIAPHFREIYGIRDNRTHSLRDKMTKLDSLPPWAERRPLFLRESIPSCDDFYRFFGLYEAGLRFQSSNDRREISDLQASGIQNAFLSEMNENQFGRHSLNGHSLLFSAKNWFQISEHIGLFVEPTVKQSFKNEGGSDLDIFAEEAYLSAGFSDHQLSIGRQKVLWGQSSYGGLLFSSNARPIDAITYTTPTWSLPYRIGRIKLAFLLGNLGAMESFSHPYVFASKFSYSPVSFFEIGFQQALVFGGDGAPEIEWWQVPLEAYTGIKTNTPGEPNLADHRAGFDARLRLPFWGTSLYVDTLIDDYRADMFKGPKAFGEFFVDQVALTAGLFAANLPPHQRLSFRFEFTRIPILVYRHFLWRDGWTIDGSLLGHPMGPDTRQFLMEIEQNWRFGSTTLWALQRDRRGDSYDQRKDPGDSVTRVKRRETRPSESIWAAGLQSTWDFNKHLSFQSNLGIAHISNANFIEANSLYTYGILFGAKLRY